MTRSLPLLLALSGCGWNHLPQQSETYLQPLAWNAENAVPSHDGLYVSLPHAGQLALLTPDDDARIVDLGEGRVSQVSAAPNKRTLVAFVERYHCDVEDPKEARKVENTEDCSSGDLRVETEIDVIQAGEVQSEVGVNGQFNALRYSKDGRFAVAYLDLNDPDLELKGVVDLTSVAVVDLQAAETDIVTVGFAADQVLFTYDPSGNADGAVVLSRSQAALVDLVSETVPVVDVTFSLTLDPDDAVVPVGVEITPDGQYALIPVQGSEDLFALDLLNRAVNIVELAGKPADIHVNRTVDRTTLVYQDHAVVEVLEHEFFDTVQFDLDEPMTHIRSGRDFEMLFSGGKDVYKLDLREQRVTEYRLENPATELHIAPTEEFVIVRTRAESGFSGDLIDSHPGFEVLDLADENGNTRPFLLQGEAVGLAWSERDTSLHALVLQQGVETLYGLDMYTGKSREIELSAPPSAIGSMPDGTFFITHDAALGLVSFFDPDASDDNAIVEVGGFAALNLLDEIELKANK